MLLIIPFLIGRIMGGERRVKLYRDRRAVCEVRYLPVGSKWEVREPSRYFDDEDEDAYWSPKVLVPSFPRSYLIEILERYDEVGILEADLAVECIRERLTCRSFAYREEGAGR